METVTAESLEQYQRDYLEKERLYNQYCDGKLTLDDVAEKINRIDHAQPKYARIVRAIVGMFLPLLFVRPSR